MFPFYEIIYNADARYSVPVWWTEIDFSTTEENLHDFKIVDGYNFL